MNLKWCWERWNSEKNLCFIKNVGYEFRQGKERRETILLCSPQKKKRKKKKSAIFVKLRRPINVRVRAMKSINLDCVQITKSTKCDFFSLLGDSHFEEVSKASWKFLQGKDNSTFQDIFRQFLRLSFSSLFNEYYGLIWHYNIWHIIYNIL